MLGKLVAVFVLVELASALDLHPCFDKWEETNAEIMSFSGAWNIYEVSFSTDRCPNVYIKPTDGRIGKFNITLMENQPQGWVTLTTPGRTERGRYSVQFPPQFQMPNFEFEVLDGDNMFDEWALLANCFEQNGEIIERPFFITRPNADLTAIDEIIKPLKEKFEKEFTKTDLSDEACEGAPKPRLF